MTSNDNRFDALIIGGGPAGSAAAATLAQCGRKVLVIEKETFPRYHVGESLMPYCYFSLERLGVLDKIKRAGFTKKQSVQFVTQDGRVSQPFYFFEHLKHEAATTWQVWRSEFDQMLLDNARERGAQVIEQTRVTDLIWRDGACAGVTTEADAGKQRDFFAPITIDATGRDALVQSKLGWRKRDAELNKISIWTYYRGAKRDPGLDEGATTVAYLPHKGWFWYIPLADDRVSVGIVAERDYLYRESRDLERIFVGEIVNNRWIAEHLAPGKIDDQFRVTGEYSYRAQHCASDGLILAGDALAFLDPVFSSGVFLALRSGELAAEYADRALAAGDFGAAQFAAYGGELCRGIESMRKLVYAFYDEGFSFRALMKKYPHLRGRLTDCLIGDLFGDFGALFAAVGEFAKMPSEETSSPPVANELCTSSS